MTSNVPAAAGDTLLAAPGRSGTARPPTPCDIFCRCSIRPAGSMPQATSLPPTRSALDVLDLAPDCIPALARLADRRHRQGQAGDGRGRCGGASSPSIPTTLPRRRPWPWPSSGGARQAEAEVSARNAIRIAPENPQAHNLLGMILTETNRPAVRRISLPPGARSLRPARPHPARQPRLEPQEPGTHGGGAGALQGIPRRGARHPPDSHRLCAAGRGRPPLRCRRRHPRGRPPSPFRPIRNCAWRKPCCSAAPARARRRSPSSMNGDRGRRPRPSRMAGERPAARPARPL